MSRLLKILIYAVVLFFLFLWLSTIVKSCGSDNETNAPSTTTSNTDDTAEEIYDEDDFFEDESADEVTDDPSEMTTESEDKIEYTEIDTVVKEKLNQQESKPAKPITTTTQTKPTKSNNTRVSKVNSNGKYMVIAGSFLIKDNALDMKNRLSKLGYENSELVVFDLSQYHSVVASRYSTYEAALKISNELKRSGVDCYVHAQQF
ncbi:MAG: SPOR domain-containing protein [Saprospiraceae bacterium]|nr:SPOR domain-containing protein [Saprospiraceae bacterium]|tara:strand:- start:4112 stop:4723 length:612 start_codon:yes stop_codon:yes gene_type:complete